MKVAVDARLMVNHPRGMGQFARALVAPLSQSEIVALLPQSQTTTQWPSISKGRSFFPWWEQANLPQLTRSSGATHLLCPSNTGPIAPIEGVKTMAVVHDLIYMESIATLPLSPSLHQNLGRLYRRLVVPRLLGHVNHIITVSNFTARQIMERYNIGAARMSVIPNSVEDDWFVKAPLLETDRLPYLLTVAGEAPSKNVAGLLAGFAAFLAVEPHSKLSLKIAGVSSAHHAAFQTKAQELGIADRVALLAPCTIETLRLLYRQCFGFIFASLYEGFGIPLLEAMASGAPIVCSNTTSLPEVAGQSAWLFDPKQPTSIAWALVQLSDSADERLARAGDGLARAAMFRRPKVAEQIRAFWETLL